MTPKDNAALAERLDEHGDRAIDDWEDWANRASSLMQEAATALRTLSEPAAERERLTMLALDQDAALTALTEDRDRWMKLASETAKERDEAREERDEIERDAVRNIEKMAAKLVRAEASLAGQKEAVGWRDEVKKAVDLIVALKEQRARFVLEQLLDAPPSQLPRDVTELVIAARIVAFEDQSPEALKQLDKASEAFADRVPWDAEPAAPHPTPVLPEAEPATSKLDEIWDDATNAVCQTLQEQNMCKCEDGKCVAATVSPSKQDRAHYAEPVAVKVKGLLEWDSIDSASQWANVKAFWLQYRITLRANGMKVLRLEMLGNRTEELGLFGEWYDARQAAQADFDKRIRECIDLSTPNPSTAGTGVSEGMVEASARAISRSYGEDPDEFAALSRMCTSDDGPVPNWRVYEEQARAALQAALTPSAGYDAGTVEACAKVAEKAYERWAGQDPCPVACDVMACAEIAARSLSGKEE